MEKVLILGGTNFIGRNIVEQLSKNENFDITLFNRGVTNTSIFKKITQIKGNRYSDDILELKKIKWDYVIDVSCYFPSKLKPFINSIKKNVKKYIFISTCSVYELDTEKYLLDENSTLLICEKKDETDKTNSSYGKRKVKCEDIIKESGINYIILRPALVYGKYDPTDRFYYWLHQVKKYQKILLPQEGSPKISLTYVLDFTNLIISFLSNDIKDKTYNSISVEQISIKELSDITQKHLENNPQYINANIEFLDQEELKQWVDIPLWIKGNFFTFKNNDELSSFEMNANQLENSISETIQYYHDLKWPMPKIGINREKQEELIHKLI